jgi:hypothetical protein
MMREQKEFTLEDDERTKEFTLEDDERTKRVHIRR